MKIDKETVNRVLPEILAFLLVTIPVLGYMKSSLWSFFIFAVFIPFMLAEWYFCHIKPTITVNRCILWGFLLFTALVVLAGVLNGDWRSARKGLHYAMCAVPGYFILYLAQHFMVKRGFLLGIAATLAGLCGTGFYQWGSAMDNRMEGIYPSPNSLGMVLELLIPFLAAFVVMEKRKSVRAVLACLLSASLACLYLTGSRGSILGLSAGVFCAGMVCLFLYRHRMKAKQLALAAVLSLAVLAAGAGALAGVSSYRGYVSGERVMMLEASYQMWEDHKLAGVGMEHWAENYYGPYRPEGQHEKGLNMPHNMIAYYLSTTGIIGTAGYFLYCVLTLGGLCQLLRAEKKPDFLCMTGLAIFWAFMAHGMVDGTFNGVRTARPYYLLFGYAIAQASLVEKKSV